MRRSFIIFVMFAFFVTGQTLAGTIGYKQISRYMDWEPDCYKPSPPSFYVSDVNSYNMAVYEFNSYLSEAQTYSDCLLTEGEADLKMLKMVISNGVDEKRSEIRNDIDSAKSDLEFQGSMLR